jgi:hypothetical protein
MSVEVHIATVTSTDDPEQRGRIRINSSSLMGDEEEECPVWVEPVPSWGWFVIPDKGELVEIECTGRTSEDEQFGQATIDNLNLKWRASKRFWGNESAAEGAGKTPIHPDFLTNYGKRRGFATPAGHIFIFDDTKKDLRVSLTWKGPSGLSTLTFDKTGKILLEVYAGEKITIDPVTHETRIIAPKVIVESPDVDLGGGAGDFALMANAFLDLFAGHIHVTAMGNSGPPLVGPSQPTTPWESARSDVVKVKATP